MDLSLRCQFAFRPIGKCRLLRGSTTSASAFLLYQPHLLIHYAANSHHGRTCLRKILPLHPRHQARQATCRLCPPSRTSRPSRSGASPIHPPIPSPYHTHPMLTKRTVPPSPPLSKSSPDAQENQSNGRPGLLEINHRPPKIRPQPAPRIHPSQSPAIHYIRGGPERRCARACRRCKW